MLTLGTPLQLHITTSKIEISVSNCTRNKMRSIQLVSFLSLSLENSSTSERHLQSSSIKYINGMVYNIIKF